ncbi:DUF2087 domain-containing protein [Robertmurraya kyonggiensis]|uniref:DUF2087 domain-containing protein n=1 Tax=Robertmurraya kyonggiensis TaxID=1037680 RepID=A0A4U1D9U6_9BACI|nr:DUF2087 domain-containing protein [Robertmurraya kyonggiensis]TKC18888.1 DUF2087 domain-containing protein [Robertmurraya kyonggiensis]
MNKEELFWSASTEEISNGYIFNQETDEYVCLICNQSFENGVMYPHENRELFYDARKAMIHHIKEQHQSMFEYLVSMDKKYSGISEHQRDLLLYFKQGLADKEIAQNIGGSTSTIRNHRFKLKEKEKQAKIFLAIMNLLEKEKATDFVPFHKGAKMVDERYAVTQEEKEKVLITYFKQGLDGPLDTFPSKEKRKLIVLQHILTKFDSSKKYTEKEVNEVLKQVFHDYVTIRRYFIEYGFMDRSNDGSAYWLKN